MKTEHSDGMKIIACPVDPEILSCFLDGELSAEESASVTAHLHECEHCRAEYEALCHIAHLTKAARAEAPASIREGVTVSLEKELRIRRIRQIKTAVGTTAAALVLMVGLSFLLPRLNVMQKTFDGVGNEPSFVEDADRDDVALDEPSCAPGQSDEDLFSSGVHFDSAPRPSMITTEPMFENPETDTPCPPEAADPAVSESDTDLPSPPDSKDMADENEGPSDPMPEAPPEETPDATPGTNSSPSSKVSHLYYYWNDSYYYWYDELREPTLPKDEMLAFARDLAELAPLAGDEKAAEEARQYIGEHS